MRMDSFGPQPESADVKPDGAEYVVRLTSVKPMQAAVERLISLDEKWMRYHQGWGGDPGSKPTNVAEGHYNPTDEVTIAVVLKHLGPGGASFLDYAFEDKKAFPGRMHVWPCAAIRTANGQTHAVLLV